MLRLRLMDRTQVPPVDLPQEGARLGRELSPLLRAIHPHRHVFQDVVPPLLPPTLQVALGCLEGTPKDYAAEAALMALELR